MVAHVLFTLWLKRNKWLEKEKKMCEKRKEKRKKKKMKKKMCLNKIKVVTNEQSVG